MRFIETAVFTRAVVELVDDESYRALQLALCLRPALGPVIPGSGGLRKRRWSRKGAGKRGGVRVIYFWHEASETFCMRFAHRTNDQENLTVQPLRVLARLVREEFG